MYKKRTFAKVFKKDTELLNIPILRTAK